ncbi:MULTISPECIES: transporter substrate-binding domain-containing protein [Cyanophyceae]|uniref:ABC transporter substrate-binding protein n=2 Tax=Cyanophyceae TaxID=3028117 RepID=A0A161US66_NODSP|nr:MULTISPECIES: transporter substrate-binding domain-containing protein [Cyanophyceae]MDB9354762.1 transporter substrate-binding domain-containing protein [Nodularia spumigena CS-587/03]KZL48663.1 ABC transporter substrate-binding protein [Nodularia spumigena CENA596]MDB9306211.1 transporter substrate-binding domain-containing protein [Nodularia spumigena CS-591/12]MDB9320339.1 transporter substrate-binding domain-containing protein [Nodularia spumigena CS-591/07A]MDB9329064.1 transporter sub
MNYRCNRWLKINQLHLVLSATIFCIVCFSWGFMASAAEMPEIQRRGYLTIAVKDNLRPLGFRDVEGNLQGLEIELAKRLALDLLGKADAVRFQPVANRDRLSVVLNNKVDLAIARVTATESRARLVSFSIPYYFDGAVIVTKDADVLQLSDLANRKIAVINNSSTIAQVRYYVPKAELVGVDSYQEGRSLTENNTVVAFAADASVLSGWVQQYPQYRLLPTKLSTEPLSVVMPKGLQYDQLRRQVNEAIAEYTAEGWLKERVQYWGLP